MSITLSALENKRDAENTGYRNRISSYSLWLCSIMEGINFEGRGSFAPVAIGLEAVRFVHCVPEIKLYQILFCNTGIVHRYQGKTDIETSSPRLSSQGEQSKELRKRCDRNINCSSPVSLDELVAVLQGDKASEDSEQLNQVKASQTMMTSPEISVYEQLCCSHSFLLHRELPASGYKAKLFNQQSIGTISSSTLLIKFEDGRIGLDNGKWLLISLRINRFEKKAGRKMNYNNQQPARFDRRKIHRVKTDEPKLFRFQLIPCVFYPEPVEEDKPLYSWFIKAGEMHAVPPSIIGTYMPTPYKSDTEETQVSYGSKSDNNTSETLSESNDFVSCDNSDKSSDSETWHPVIQASRHRQKNSPPLLISTTLPDREFTALLLSGGYDPAASRNKPAANLMVRPNPAGLVSNDCNGFIGGVAAGVNAVKDLSRVSITNPHNKTPYALLSGKVPQIGHLKPFGCQVTILNTSDHLGKFKGKADEGLTSSSTWVSYVLWNRNADYAEELPNVALIEQEYEAIRTASCTIMVISEIRNQGVSADRDPAGIDSADRGIMLYSTSVLLTEDAQSGVRVSMCGTGCWMGSLSDVARGMIMWCRCLRSVVSHYTVMSAELGTHIISTSDVALSTPAGRMEEMRIGAVRSSMFEIVKAYVLRLADLLIEDARSLWTSVLREQELDEAVDCMSMNTADFVEPCALVYVDQFSPQAVTDCCVNSYPTYQK
ncbi:hypothetical protein Tco_0164842 [Tanacetum coccineum]